MSAAVSDGNHRTVLSYNTVTNLLDCATTYYSKYQIIFFVVVRAVFYFLS